MPQPVSAAFKAMQASPDRVVAERLEIDLPLWRHNLAPYPSPEGGNLGNWSAGAGIALTGDSTFSYVGQFSTKAAVVHLGGGIGGISAAPIPMPWAGDQVAGSVRIRVNTALTGALQAYWLFIDDQGNVIGTSTASTYGGAVTGGWVALGNVATIPAGATQGLFVLQPANPTSADVFWLDALLVERAGTLGTYFDGDVDATVNLFTNPVIARDLRDILPGLGDPVTLAIDTAWSPEGQGGHSVAITPTGGGTNTYVDLGTGAGSSGWGMAAGKTYTVSATVNVPAALTGTLDSRACSIVLYTDTGAGPVLHQSTQGPTGGGTRRLSLTVTIPAGAGEAYIRLYHGGSAGAGLVRWGDILIIDNPNGQQYTRTRARWDGVRLASTSRLNTAPYYVFGEDTVDSASVARSITTDLPNTVSLASGYPTAAGTFGLSGPLNRAELDETRTAFWLFNRYNQASPIYGLDLTGADVRYWAGLYTGAAMSGNPADPELVQQLAGHLDQVTIDAIAQTVSLKCVDGRDRLRGDITLPAVAFASAGALDVVVTPGLLSGWVMDFLLRASGIHSSPPPRDRCALYCGMNGSVWPDVAGSDLAVLPLSLPTISASLDAFIDPVTGGIVCTPADFLGITKPGPWHQQCLRNPVLLGVPSAIDPLSINAGGGWFFEGDLYVDPTQNSTSGPSFFGLRNSSGTASATVRATWNTGDAAAALYLDTFRGSTNSLQALGISITTGTWHHMAIQINYPTSTTATVTVWIDYARTPITVNLTGLPATPGGLCDQTEFFWGGWADAIQITGELAATPQPVFAPEAFLDASLNALQATVETLGVDPWQTIQQLVEAERGYGGFDECGTFRFSNRGTLAAAPAGATLDAKVNLETYGTDTSRSATAQWVQVPTSAWKQLPGSDVWSATDQIKVPRRGSYTTVLSLQSPALAPLTADNGYAPGVHVVGRTEWRASRTPGGTTPVTTGIAVSAVNLSPTRVQLTISNSNTFDVWMVSDSGHSDVSAGTAFVYVAGVSLQPPTAAPVADALWPPDGSSAVTAVKLAVPANVWLQDLDSADDLAVDLLAQLYVPRDTWTGVEVIGDPTIQLTDRAHATDAETGLDDYAVAFGHTFTSSASAWGSSLDLRAIAAPGRWVLGLTGRSELAQTTRT